MIQELKEVCPDCNGDPKEYPYKDRMIRQQDAGAWARARKAWLKLKNTMPNIEWQRLRPVETQHQVKRTPEKTLITACGIQYDLISI